MPVHEQPSAASDLDELRRRAVATAVPRREAGLVVCENLVRIYQTEGVEVQALQGLDLTVADGEMIAVIGASGSGKSTLLGILSGQDVPTGALDPENVVTPGIYVNTVVRVPASDRSATGTSGKVA